MLSVVRFGTDLWNIFTIEIYGLFTFLPLFKNQIQVSPTSVKQ